MKKYLFLLFIIVVGFAVEDVQKEFISLNWKETSITAEDIPVYAELNFENADFPVPGSLVPYYTRIFDVKDKNQNFNFSIENPVFEEIKLADDFRDAHRLGNEIGIESRKLQARETVKIQLQISTIKKENDKIYRLKSFELKRIPAGSSEILKNGQLSGGVYNWKASSVLKQGKWVKIAISEKGIIKIPYSKLISLGFPDPAKVNVYGSGGIILSEDPGEINYDDLIQCAVWRDKNNGADCLFFYAPGTTEWTYDAIKRVYRHRLNDYSTKGYFFLTNNVGNPKNAELLTAITNQSTLSVATFDAYQLYENETENVLLLGSGKQWFGDKFKHNTIKNIDFNLADIVVSEPIKIRINAIGRSYANSEMQLQLNQTNIGSLNFNKVSTGSQSSVYADEKGNVFSQTVQGGQNRLTLKYLASGGGIDDNALAWLDFIEINYKQKLRFAAEALFFRDQASVGAENIVSYSLENALTGSRVFDVTDVNNVKEMQLTFSSNVAVFKRQAKQLAEYVAFNPNGNFREPEYLGEVQNQDIHSISTPELLIVTHPNFLNQANRLANIHRSYDGMDVQVITTEMVYNEFSSGEKSATGIRNFIKMLYDRGNKLKYVLLFGDGSYDNRGLRASTKNFVPTYQSANSLDPVASFVTDDYFSIMDAGESVYDAGEDLGVGRIPSSTVFEAETAVNKIENYYSPRALGNWRNIVCFIGDDKDGGLHMSDSEQLAGQVNLKYGEYITDKIYFDSYLKQVSAGVERYPGVTQAINKRVKDGVLILNYIGHGNERFMSDEKVLDISTVNSWSNINNLPIFVTATCEFSRFDADDMSIGEYILFNPAGGGIGLFSTTRLVYAYSNFLLSKSFYNFVFETDTKGNRYRMGDIMRLAKNNTINTINKRSFSLLANPALRLSYPKNKVVTTSINNKAAQNFNDTIKSLQKVDIEGFVSDYSGNIINNFSGEMAITVYDKETKVSTLGNNGETPFQFKVQENIIYKGRATVASGRFSFSFVVPKDVSFAVGKGKIMYYAQNNEVDAHGVFNKFTVGGLSGQTVTDNKGPEIKLFIDNMDFKTGGKTSKNPTLIASIFDESGINTAGTGIGHDITAILNDNNSNALVLNNFFESDINDYKKGILNFSFKNLTVGKHKLTLKAWDVANNSSEAEIEFEVTGDFYVSAVSNTPNPATGFTFFTFEHNQSDATIKTMIEVFDLSGKRVQYIVKDVGSNGTKSNPVRWDFNDTQTFLKNSIYIYRITAQNEEGTYSSKSGKMLISR